MKRTTFMSFLLGMIALFLFLIPNSAYANDKVYHIPVEKEVEKGLYEFLKRSFNEAIENHASAIVLEIHTPGGYVDVAYDIGKLIEETPTRIISFINSKAHSAGAYIALQTNEIYMTPNATMGAAQMIDMQGNAASAKANSAWIKNMQAAAESTNRDPKFARAMADSSIDLPELNSPRGNLLTLTADEALNVAYSEGTVENLDEVLEKAGLSNSEVISIDETFADKLARFLTNPIIVTLLLTIAFVGLMFELFSPGFGASGILGLISLALFFYGHTVAGFAGYETVLLFMIGLGFIIAEFFVPGGIVGLIGGALVIISLLFTGESVVHMAYSILIAMAIAIIGMVVLVKFLGKNLHLLSKLILKDATTTEEGYVSNVNRIELLGKEGITLTPLRPSGSVIVGNEKLDVVSDGSYIDSDKKVKIIEVEGSRIVVREIKEREEKS